ncbi:AraC family transcriptional regulator [Solimonas sp. K1W22B-7]|uniref:AraC family transcriptional regulator n=1 Tax=Solimonas sp. K1W22B-7 TaxID=2303331 RepID=UPI000E3339EE|nr:AraC family transcriptional regulator [Solimonas sp. K1W22B-7]AXQ31151.1 AraC family transcriptional regulator [Solimonas sp. K1W22B-7]
MSLAQSETAGALRADGGLTVGDRPQPRLSPIPNWNVRHGIAGVRRLAQLAGEQGMALETCLDGTGIAPAMLDGDEVDILVEQEIRLIRKLLLALPQARGMGLDLGLRHQLTDFGIWGYALISSRTLREAFQVCLRYIDLCCVFGKLACEESGGEVRVRFDYDQVPADIRPFVVERDAGAIAAVQRQICGVALPLRHVDLAYPRPAHAARLAAHFGLQPRYDAPGSMLVVASQVFDQPLPQANDATLRMCDAECRKLLARRQAYSGVAARVRDIILRCPAEALDMEAVAARLCMTGRTLRRHLSEQGTTFRALRDEVLQMLAEELLRTTPMKLDEVAERLGYSDSAAFSHAFKRWKGVAPRALGRS